LTISMPLGLWAKQLLLAISNHLVETYIHLA
jgi:hypothetical protein